MTHPAITSGLSAAQQKLDEAEAAFSACQFTHGEERWMAEVNLRLARLEYAQMCTVLGNR